MKFFSSLICGRAACGVWYLFIALAVATSASADDSQPDEKVRTRIVPLIFLSENTGVAYGLGGVSIGAGQPQAPLFALGFTAQNDSKAISVGALNYQIPNITNLFFSGFFYQSDMPDYR
jgi:hypothetical protein